MLVFNKNEMGLNVNCSWREPDEFIRKTRAS